MVWYPPRPVAIDRNTEEENWRRTFGPRKEKQNSSGMSRASVAGAETTPPNTQTGTPSASAAGTMREEQLDLFLNL